MSKTIKRVIKILLLISIPVFFHGCDIDLKNWDKSISWSFSSNDTDSINYISNNNILFPINDSINYNLSSIDSTKKNWYQKYLVKQIINNLKLKKKNINGSTIGNVAQKMYNSVVYDTSSHKLFYKLGGLDCSGFVYLIVSNLKIWDCGRFTTKSIYNLYNKKSRCVINYHKIIETNSEDLNNFKDSLQHGDIILWPNYNNKTHYGHIGIIVNYYNDFWLIHSFAKEGGINMLAIDSKEFKNIRTYDKCIVIRYISHK